MRRIRKQPDLSHQVADQIRVAILRGDYPPGSRIRQVALADRLAVSRAPVREALLVLEREGLIQTDSRGAAIVAPVDANLIRDLYGFRAGVERYVAETLASRSDFALRTKGIREILDAGTLAAGSDDRSALIDLDLQFHTTLYEALENRILSGVMCGQWTNMRRVMSATLTISGYSRQIWHEHEQIVAAIVAQDPERAGRLAVGHTTAACARLTERLTSGIQEIPFASTLLDREHHFGPE
jgi:DNA-binding GntR family transcriptional regulator